jgi:outer membrane protein assembly factor BamB
MADIHGRPVIDRGRVFAVSHSGRMMAIELRNGSHVWEQDLASSHEPWCAGEFIFLLANDNEVVCLTRNEGKVRWACRCPISRTWKRRRTRSTGPARCWAANQLIALSSSGVAMFLSPHDRRDAVADRVVRQRLSRPGHRRQHALSC